MREAMPDDLAMMSATQLLAEYRTKRLSPVDVTRAVLQRIESCEPGLNAFRFVAWDEALDAARLSEERWHRGEPLGLVDGVPTTIKDMSLTKGWATLHGSKTVSPDGPWDEDSPHVARLREQGAVLLGKTTMSEFGWKAVTDSPLTGISRNPWSPIKTCGGSSGGAAIAAAVGMGALHDSSDGGGSIRIPAAFCGVFGLKPTFGRVPRYPHGARSGTQIVHMGPTTRTVADAALMLSVIAMPDDRDWLALPADGRDYRIGLDRGVQGVRIAYSTNLGNAWVNPEIADIVADAMNVFEDLGAVVEHRDPDMPDPRGPFETLYASSVAWNLKGLTHEAIALMDPDMVALGRRGQRLSADDIYTVWQARDEVAVHMARFHRTYDLLITPQLPIAAFDVGKLFPDGYGMASMFDWLALTYPFNLTRQPAASVPCGFTRDGLPVALQIVGPLRAEERVLQASRAFESVRPFRMPEVNSKEHRTVQQLARAEPESRKAIN